MAILSLKICLGTLLVLCMINSADCGKNSKLEKRIGVLEKVLAALEKEVRLNEDELQSYVEQTLEEFKSSVSGEFGENIQQLKQHLETETSFIKTRTEKIEAELLDLGTELTAEVNNFDTKLRSPIVKCWIKGTFFGNSCYMMDRRKNWHQARNFCERMGAYLAEVNSKEESEFLERFIKNKGPQYTFIGGNDTPQEGNWKWITSNKTLTYRNWRQGEPNGKRKENCIIMDSNPGWMDWDCTAELNFVCEFTPKY